MILKFEEFDSIFKIDRARLEKNRWLYRCRGLIFTSRREVYEKLLCEARLNLTEEEIIKGLI